MKIDGIGFHQHFYHPNTPPYTPFWVSSIETVGSTFRVQVNFYKEIKSTPAFWVGFVKDCKKGEWRGYTRIGGLGSSMTLKDVLTKIITFINFYTQQAVQKNSKKSNF